MKKALKIIIPILMTVIILCSIGWYLFVYDSDFTRDLLLHHARNLEEDGKHSAAVWIYNLAYSQSGEDESVAIELADQFKSLGNYTKAEYTLSNAIANGGSVELYTALSKIYIEQDKLLDAVAMLDGIQSAEIKAEIDALRPSAPVPDPQPGFFNQYIDVHFTSDEGTLYVTSDGSYPSVQNVSYEDGLNLPAGESTIRALTIGENGLISPLSISTYTVVGVVEPVVFQDSAIESAVRELLNVDEKAVVYTSDLWTILEFEVPRDAADYSDLSNMIHLKKLTVPSPQSDEMGFLSSLTELESLNISNAALSSDTLNLVGKLITLTELSLEQCGLSSVAPLSSLTNLKRLSLNQNSIRDLSPLTGLVALERLSLPYNAVDSVSTISTLPMLSELDLANNRLSSVASIGAAVNMTYLNLNHNFLTDLTAVGNLKNLTDFYAAENNITEVSPLIACTQLQNLDISNNKVADIAQLYVLENLKDFNFSHNEVTVLPKWSEDSALTVIDGSYNALTSLDELRNLYNLNRVNMDYNKELESIDALALCPVLVQVDVYGTLVTDVSALTEHSIIVNFDPTSISVTDGTAESEE